MSKPYAKWEDRSDLRLLSNWLDERDSRFTNNICSIADVSAPEDSPPELSIRFISSSGIELLAALRQPPKHVRVQVVFWPVELYTKPGS